VQTDLYRTLASSLDAEFSLLLVPSAHGQKCTVTGWLYIQACVSDDDPLFGDRVLALSSTKLNEEITMFDVKRQLDVPLDLMASVTSATQAITLKDFLELTSHLSKDTPLFALIYDDDEVEYARQIVSAAIRVERHKGSEPTTCIELKVQSDF
jgi:hypothetical protein